MLLPDLCEDALNIIISFLSSIEGGAGSLLNLALTCRALDRLARPLITKCVSVRIPSSGFDLLRRSLNEDPEYGYRIRELKLRGFLPHSIDGTQLFAFFKQIPYLRIFCDRMRSDWWRRQSLLSRDLLFRNTLVKISLVRNHRSSDELLQLLSFPQLRWLDFGNRFCTEVSDVSSSADCKSELEYLNLGGSQIGYPLLEVILRRTSVLKTLLCNAPFEKPGATAPIESRSPPTGAYIVRMVHPFSPARIRPVLTPLEKTLTVLHLSTRAQRWPSHDGSRLDLSKFVSLKSLYAAAMYFVSPLSLEISRQGMYKLLPQSLRVLDLEFCFEMGVFYSMNYSQRTDELEPSLVLSRDNIPESNYGWIVELAEQKFGLLPYLERATFWENRRKGECLCFRGWSPPLLVTSAFDRAQIKLDVHLGCTKRAGALVGQ